jgi:hypothetical protein
MAILLIWSVLLGAVLGRFFKVLVLVPACAFQIGYVSGLLSFLIHSVSQRQGKPRPRATGA